MVQIKNAMLFRAIGVLIIIPISCADDRDCGEDYIYNDQDSLCHKVSSSKPNEKASVSDAEVDQDGSIPTPTGMGDSCTDQEQCADKEADYCSINPLDGTGFCTITGCNSDAECPAGYYCCLAPESYGGHTCVTEELYEMGKAAEAC